jgi:hypothetical protein
MLGIVLAGVFTVFGNLRNVGVWLLQLRGKRADGTVEAVEFVSSENFQSMRRPVVAFTTERGERIVTKPALYRKSMRWAKGMTVPVRYASGKPERMVVPGFGLRYREPVYAIIGALVAIAVPMLYFRI